MQGLGEHCLLQVFLAPDIPLAKTSHMTKPSPALIGQEVYSTHAGRERGGDLLTNSPGGHTMAQS
jgi:hypothetical protein